MYVRRTSFILFYWLYTGVIREDLTHKFTPAIDVPFHMVLQTADIVLLVVDKTQSDVRREFSDTSGKLMCKVRTTIV